jgi:hypothetical protein
VLSTFMLAAFKLYTFMLSTFMLSAFMLSTFMLSTFTLSTFMLSTFTGYSVSGGGCAVTGGAGCGQPSRAGRLGRRAAWLPGLRPRGKFGGVTSREGIIGGRGIAGGYFKRRLAAASPGGV